MFLAKWFTNVYFIVDFLKPLLFTLIFPHPSIRRLMTFENAIVNGNIFKFCLNTLLGVHAKDLNWWNFFRMINFYVDKLNLFNFRIYISNLEFFPHLWTEFLIEYRTMLNASRSQTFVLLHAPLLPPGMPFLLLHSANFCSFADLIHMCPLSWGLRESSPLHLWDCACTLFAFP